MKAFVFALVAAVVIASQIAARRNAPQAVPVKST